MRISRPPWVASRAIANEVIAYNLASSCMLTLDLVASSVWQEIPRYPRFASSALIARTIAKRYSVGQERVRDDLATFFSEMTHKGLLVEENNSDIVSREDKDVRQLFSSTISRGFEGAPEDANMSIEEDVIARMERRNQLYAVTLELTQRCNERCVHCYAIKSSNTDCVGELSAPEFVQVIDQLHEMGCLCLVLTGGEALFRRDFLDIYRHARSKDFVVDIFSNGLLLKGETLEAICSRYPRAIYLSVYSMTPHIHDSITRVPGSLTKTVATIRHLRERNVNVIINITVIKMNVDHFEGILDFAEEVGAGHRLSFDISPNVGGDLSPISFRIASREEVSRLLEKRYVGRAYERYRFDSEQRVCNAGAASLSISPTGEVYPCLSLRKSLGNVRTDKLAEIWGSSEERVFIRDIKWKDRRGCLGCEHKNYCTPCMGISELEHGDLFCGNDGDCFNAACKHEFVEGRSRHGIT